MYLFSVGKALGTGQQAQLTRPAKARGPPGHRDLFPTNKHLKYWESQECWHTPSTAVLWRQGQVGFCDFEGSVAYLLISKPGQMASLLTRRYLFCLPRLSF